MGIRAPGGNFEFGDASDGVFSAIWNFNTHSADYAWAEGTSMASPHVAGVGVLYKATFGDAASATVSNWIITNSTTGVITGNGNGTPNRLLFKGTL